MSLRGTLLVVVLALAGCEPTSNIVAGSADCFGSDPAFTEPDSGSVSMSIGDDVATGDWRFELSWVDVGQTATFEFLACQITDGTETFTYAGAFDLEAGATPYTDVPLVNGFGGTAGTVRGAYQRTVDGDQDRWSMLDSVTGSVVWLDADAGEAEVSFGGSGNAMSDVEAEDGAPEFQLDFDVLWTP